MWCVGDPQNSPPPLHGSGRVARPGSLGLPGLGAAPVTRAARRAGRGRADGACPGHPSAEGDRRPLPLPTLAGELRRAADELENGRGFVLVRGIPVERYSEEEAAVLLWGVGQHLGIPVSQDATGHMLGHLRDGPDVRAVPSPRTEAADALALLCLRAAGSGARTALASSAAVHNAVLAGRPELLDGLSRTHFLDRRGEQLPGGLPGRRCRSRTGTARGSACATTAAAWSPRSGIPRYRA